MRRVTFSQLPKQLLPTEPRSSPRPAYPPAKNMRCPSRSHSMPTLRQENRNVKLNGSPGDLRYLGQVS